MLDKLLRRTVNLDKELNALKSKVKLLAAAEADNSSLVENAEIQPGKKRKREVELWFTHVQDIKTTLEQIETEFAERGPNNDLKCRIEKRTKEVDELIQRGKFPKGVVLDDLASTRVPLVTMELVGQSCLENIASVLSWLKEDVALTIGIHGMGGVGKTTLMKHIHNKILEDMDIERKVYWVTASQECSLQKLQIDIGKALGLNDISQYDEERRLALLFRKFSQLGKFVLLLDDLWKHYPTEGIGIPCNMCGCKMIISTRSLDVCNRMNCRKTIKISPLSRLDSMKLFVETLGVEVPAELNPIAEKIVAECGGLPLALKTIGCCMRGMDCVLEWQNALCELRTPVIRQVSMEEEVFRVLKFSYYNLKDKKIQHCFLSCVLYPEDYEILPDTLVRLWINEGLLDEVESYQDRVIRGQAILNKLEKSCLLESVTPRYFATKCVKMHDLIRDMAMIITQDNPRFMAKSRIHLEEVPEKEQWSEDLLKVSLSNNCIREIPCELASMTMKLTVLLLNNNPLKKIPESFFTYMRALRVLDLSETAIKRLPKIVSKMDTLRALLLGNCYKLIRVPSLLPGNLRTLDLSGTIIKRLPNSVSNLVNLRELLLGHCERLTCVPSLARLTNMRVLDLEGDKQLERAPRGLERLKKLEELPYCPWNVNDMSRFCRLVRSSPALSCFRFLFSSSGTLQNYNYNSEVWNWFMSYKRVMWITGAEFGEEEIVLIPVTINALKIVKSEMKGKRALGDVFPSLGESTNLTELVIEDFSNLIYIISGLHPGTYMRVPLLDSLEKLCLQELSDLKRITKFRGCSFSNLRTLIIKNCPKIKDVFQLSNHQTSLPNLTNLQVWDCEEVDQIFKSNNDTQPNPVLVLPNLQCLLLFNLPKLGSIYKGLLLFNSYVTIENCPSLKMLEGIGCFGKVICDASSSTVESLSYGNAKDWWKKLYTNYPQAACTLSSLISNLESKSDDEEKDDKSS